MTQNLFHNSAFKVVCGYVRRCVPLPVVWLHSYGLWNVVYLLWPLLHTCSTCCLNVSNTCKCSVLPTEIHYVTVTLSVIPKVITHCFGFPLQIFCVSRFFNVVSSSFRPMLRLITQCYLWRISPHRKSLVLCCKCIFEHLSSYRGRAVLIVEAKEVLLDLCCKQLELCLNLYQDCKLSAAGLSDLLIAIHKHQVTCSPTGIYLSLVRSLRSTVRRCHHLLLM